MKKLNYVLILLLFLPMLSCKKKYTLDGSIDNSDFIGKWVWPLGTGHHALEITEKGKVIYTVASYDNNSPDRDGRTSEKKGRVQIEGDQILLEYRFLMQENNINELQVIQAPTSHDTTFTIGNNGNTTVKGTAFIEVHYLNSKSPVGGYSAGEGDIYYKMKE